MYKLIRPLLFSQDPETMHNLMTRVGSGIAQTPLKSLTKAIYNYSHPMLEQDILGVHFSNPVGLAAGFDKHAKLVDFLSALGLSYVEIGSITAVAKEGNPLPRLFRLTKDEAIINRMGLNNEGADAIASKLRGRTVDIPFGMNITKTHDPEILGDKAIEDFVYSFRTLYGLGAYMTINVSCPNTAEGKTFESPDALDALLSTLRAAESFFEHKIPLLLKVSPDLSVEALDTVLEVGQRYSMSGYIISNTSMKRDGLRTSAARLEEIGKGGLSGRPVARQSTNLIAHAYRQLRAARVEHPMIIGLGGIFSAQDAYEKIRAGASLVQVYTGLIYEGPGLVKKINRGLVKLLQRDGFSSIKEVAGTAVDA